jgi:concanavalin A-like lectin/glucanase superfamily protein
MAWLFDAATDKVLVPSGWTGAAFTVCMWVKRTSATANTHGNNPFRAWSNAAGGGSTIAGMDAQGASRNTFVAYDSAFTQTVGLDVRADAGWHPVALVVNGTAWALFTTTGTDPAALTKVTATRATGATAGSFTLSDSPTDWFDGAIANVKVFGAALTDAEVAAELATYAQVRSTNLLFRATLSTSSNTPETGTTMTAGSTAVAVVAGPAALDPVTGVLAASVQRPVPALAGLVRDLGTLGATLQLPVGSLAGTVPDRGVLAASVALPTAALAGLVRVQGLVTAAVPPPIGNIAGIARPVGALAATVPLPTAFLHEVLPVLTLPLRAGTPTTEPGLSAGSPTLTAGLRAGPPEAQ